MILRDRFLNLENLWYAWEEVEDHNGCPGVDGETIHHFSRYEAQALQQLYKAIATGHYRPMPLRQLLIPKKKGWRELGVPTIRDRIVQQALLQVLHAVSPG
jgi:retron-type reverse transcriptase